MRRTAFGDIVIENTDDDLGEALMEDNAVYASIQQDEDGGAFYFDIQRNDDGEQVASSESIFASVDDAKKYIGSWLPLKDIQVNV